CRPASEDAELGSCVGARNIEPVVHHRRDHLVDEMHTRLCGAPTNDPGYPWHGPVSVIVLWSRREDLNTPSAEDNFSCSAIELHRRWQIIRAPSPETGKTVTAG